MMIKKIMIIIYLLINNMVRINCAVSSQNRHDNIVKGLNLVNFKRTMPTSYRYSREKQKKLNVIIKLICVEKPDQGKLIMFLQILNSGGTLMM